MLTRDHHLGRAKNETAIMCSIFGPALVQIWTNILIMKARGHRFRTAKENSK